MQQSKCIYVIKFTKIIRKLNLIKFKTQNFHIVNLMYRILEEEVIITTKIVIFWCILHQIKEGNKMNLSLIMKNFKNSELNTKFLS